MWALGASAAPCRGPVRGTDSLVAVARPRVDRSACVGHRPVERAICLANRARVARGAERVAVMHRQGSRLALMRTHFDTTASGLPRPTTRLRRAASWRAAAVAGGTAAAVAAAPSARAGNVDSYYLGNQAALQAGAVTANAELGTAVWYNPAGLARVEPLAVDASATAFALSLGQRADLDSSVPGAEATRLESVAFAIVPASLSVVRRWGAVGLGLGLFVPRQEAVALRTRLRVPELSSSASSELGVDLNSREQAYYGGAALGVSLSPLVDVGAGLFINYSSSLDIIALASSGRALAIGTGASVSHITNDTQTISILPTLGLQLHPGSGWRTGLSLQLPEQRIYRLAQSVTMAGGFDPTGTSLVNEFDETTGFSTGRVAPMRLNLGVARHVSGGHIALDASFRQHLNSGPLDVQQRPVVNARLGGAFVLDERWTLGGGIFSDRSPELLETSAQGSRVHYYGVSFGLQLDKQYDVVERMTQAAASVRPLVFRTTAVVTYSLGAGQIQRIDLARGTGGDTELLPRERDVIEHQLIVHIGSTILD